jgi:Aerotolerance regulator N-terminal/CARDB
MSEWIAQHFLHPSYVLPVGAALLAVPVIIHLINRLRYRRVRFAAMEFLLQSQQRNRRRLLIEQLLLLLLRMAIVAAILLLISRLVLDPSALWAFRGGKSHHVVLLDDSGSMQDRWGETSAFKEALSIVRRLVAEGARRPGTQQCTLLLLSHPDRPLFLKHDVNNAFAVELENTFERLECSHQALDLVTGIDAAGKLLAQDPGAVRHLHVISDFRAYDWRERPALRAAFSAVAKTGTSIDFARTVNEPHDNLSITDLGGEVRTAAAGVPVRLKATVRNFGSKVANHVRLGVMADGSLLPLGVEIEKLEPGTEQSRDIDVSFKKPGKHTVEVQLPEDALASDNHRYAALDISVANPVLIIDGDNSSDSDDGSYVLNALAADPSITGFSPRIESTDFLTRESLDAFRCIYLLDVHDLRADAVERLAEYVRKGGGIAWFLGGAVNTTFYNEELYKKAGGLFPVPLARVPKVMTRPDVDSPAPDLSFANRPPFQHFFGQENPFVHGVKINMWFPVGDKWVRDDNRRKDEVATIAHVATSEPIAFERSFGKGKILAFLTTAGPKWNDWGVNPSVVIFHLELAKYIARENQTLDHRIVGEPIEVAFDPAEFLETVEITAPDAHGQRVIRVKATRPASEATPGVSTGAAHASLGPEPQADGQSAGPASGSKSPPATTGLAAGTKPLRGASNKTSVRVAATYGDTDRPGMYIVRLFKDQSAAPQERWISYNVPLQESDLQIATTPEILGRLSNDVHVQIHDPGAFQWIEGHSASQEARTLLLVLLAVLLVVEQFFALRLSYHPPVAKGGSAT